MVNTLIFDFWGTLVENGIRSPIKEVKQILNIKMPFSEYVVKMERAMMTMPFHSLAEAFEAVVKEFGLSPPPEVIDELVGMWNKSWMLAQPYEEVEGVLGKLQKKYRLVLISNTDNHSVTKVLEKYKLGEFFEKMFFSYELGKIKTDKEFLMEILSRLGVTVDECVLIGDSLHSDIAAAQHVGMRAILVDRRATRGYMPTVQNLREIEGGL